MISEAAGGYIGISSSARAPSKVRMKLFTLDNRLLRGTLGHSAEPDERRVRAALVLLLPAG